MLSFISNETRPCLPSNYEAIAHTGPLEVFDMNNPGDRESFHY